MPDTITSLISNASELFILCFTCLLILSNVSLVFEDLELHELSVRALLALLVYCYNPTHKSTEIYFLPR